ncbi:MAG: MFS transporter [Burkholderiaceae bacterium]|nr:MFS transporter [Burkholderiaceae bacterium]
MRQLLDFLRQIDPTHHATRLIFLIVGASCAVWAAMVPFLKIRLGVDEAQLGLLLLCLGAGSICVMPFTGTLVAKFGCRRVIAFALTLSLLTLPLIATVSSVWMAALVIASFGALVGAADVAMNIQSVIVEKRSGRAMLSGFHAMFSVGGLLGALAVTLLFNVNLSELATVVVMLSTFVVGLLYAVPRCIERSEPANDQPHESPKGRLSGFVIFVGVLCFVMFLTEGSVMDWSAVYLREVSGLSAENAALGFAFFSATMTVGRLTGDRVIARLGRQKTVLIGGALSSAAFALLALGIEGAMALIVFALIGLGASNLIPVFFWAAGNQRVMPVEQAMATASTLGYLGILAGPAAIGFVAHAVSLPFAFAIIAAMVAAVSLSSYFLGK